MRKLCKVVFIFLLFALFLAEFFHPITAISVDLGRHLLLGKIITATHQIPRTNLLSFTYPNFPYINSSWLTDVLYNFLFAAGGFNLLLIFNTFIIALAFGLLIYQAVKKNGLTVATLVCTAVYLLLLGFRSDIRPEVMSMLCLSLFLLILYQVRESHANKLLFLLPLLEVVWVNMHIYFFVGPLLIVLFLLDHLIGHRFTFAKIKAYGFSLLGTLIAMVINPNGITGAVFPVMVLRNYGLPVVENQSILTLFTLYHASEILLPLIAMLLLFTVLFLTRKQTQPIDWLLAIVFSIATVVIFRNILLFVFTTFLVFTTQLNILVKKCEPLLKKLPIMLGFFSYLVSVLLLLLFITTSIKNNGFGFGVKATSEKAVNFLIDNHIQGTLYNNFDIGDYLSYRLYPQKVFVENRPEAYPANFFQDIYLPMQNDPNIFNAIMRKYHITTVVISYWDNTPWGTKLLPYLVNNSHFKLVYLDAFTIILIADTTANHPFIMHHQITENSLRLNGQYTSEEQIHYLFFFEKVGWQKKVNSALARMRKTDPQLCSLKQYPLENSSIEKYIDENSLNKNCTGVVTNL